MNLEKMIGERHTLTVVKQVDFGVYLGTDQERVLLPKREVPAGISTGDSVEVFLYRDSDDRLIATTRTPKLMMGELAVLRVADVGRIGAFLDWGLPKDLLLPFREQTARVKKGDEVLAALYQDKSGRLCATMKVYDRLQKNAPYKKDDEVHGMIYETSRNFGVFVAVDNKYSALIPKREAYGTFRVGDTITARVAGVHEDGRLDLSVRRKAFLQMDDDAAMILRRIQEYGGTLPFTDKADAETIRAEFELSKNAFKRAVGKLLREEQIIIETDCIRII